MKGPLDRTKVVLRHLPPTITESNLVEHVDSRFAGRYRWLEFCPGKSSQKHRIHSRAYIEFNRPEDVIEFSEFFNGHVFVNEKGTQYKASVEYAPSQRVPKQWLKKDGREGTILKDPEYLEFLEFLAKPVENLPSAEIQLERKEAERAAAGTAKDGPIVTPLMDYVRQKRAAKIGARRAKRTSGIGISSRMDASGLSKRGSEKKRTSTTKYILRDSSKGGNKGKTTILLVPKHDDQQLTEKSDKLDLTGTGTLEGESGGGLGSTGIVKKKILLLKGKEKEISYVSDGSSMMQNAVLPAKNSHSTATMRNNQQNETGVRVIKSILLNRDKAPSASQPEIRIQTPNQDKDKRPPRPPSIYSSLKETNGIPEDKIATDDFPSIHTEKQERRMKNKDRPERGVWTPLRRSDGSHSSNDSLSSSTSQSSQVVDSTEDVKNEIMVGRGGENRQIRGGRGSHFSVDSGFYRHGSRRGSAYNTKDADGSGTVEGKQLKRVVSSGYGSHEKQVWVQKSSSGS